MLFKRYSRKQYWLWSLGLLIIIVSMIVPLAMMNHPTGGSGGAALLMLLGVLLAGLYCKLVVHRLHDIGWSGWWILLLGPLLIIVPLLMFRESHEVYLRIEQSYEAQQAIKGYVAFMLFGSFAIFIGGFAVLGLLPGSSGPKTHGPDPFG